MHICIYVYTYITYIYIRTNERSQSVFVRFIDHTWCVVLLITNRKDRPVYYTLTTTYIHMHACMHACACTLKSETKDNSKNNYYPTSIKKSIVGMQQHAQKTDLIDVYKSITILQITLKTKRIDNRRPVVYGRVNNCSLLLKAYQRKLDKAICISFSFDAINDLKRHNLSL